MDMRDMICQMFRSVAAMDHVLELPFKIPTSDRSSTSIKATDDYNFEPLPKPNFAKLQKKTPSEVFKAPVKNCFAKWADPVTKACFYLTDAKRTSDKVIECAGFSMDTLDPICDLQDYILQGEMRGFPTWHATALLASPRRYGYIIKSYESRKVTCNQILRSELLALLSLFEIAGMRALQGYNLARNQPVFLLSFTQHRARVLEARFEGLNEISVSIRQVLDKVPTEKERDQVFEDMIRWSMFMDDNDAYSLGLDECDESASTAAAVPASATTRMNSHSDKWDSSSGGHGGGVNWKLICLVSIFFVHVSFVKRLTLH
ncbi:hypothetical protein EV127DRAFT_441101 [Xylaria flabelliformis]|nr:hypothetical protein EV127DRAFT_441101 [Xylaria flabelliformis]